MSMDTYSTYRNEERKQGRRNVLLQLLACLVVLIVAVSIVTYFVGQSGKVHIDAGQYVLVLDENGHLTDTIHGPADVPDPDNNIEVLTDAKTDVVSANLEYDFGSTVTIEGVEYTVPNKLTVSVSFDQAVDYFNDRVDQGDNAFSRENFFWFPSNGSLQDWVLYDISNALAYGAYEEDTLFTPMQFVIDGSPTTTTADGYTSALYQGDLAAQTSEAVKAAREEEFVTARDAALLEAQNAAIDELCLQFSDANQFEPGLCPESTQVAVQGPGPSPQGGGPSVNTQTEAPSHNNAPPAPPTPPTEPAGNSGGDEGTNTESGGNTPPPDDAGYYRHPSYKDVVGGNTYDFGCATYPVTLTNKVEFSRGIASVLQTDAVTYSWQNTMDLLTKTELPCSIVKQMHW